MLDHCLLAMRPGASFSTSLRLSVFSDNVDKGEDNGTCQRGRTNELINPFKALSVNPACSPRPSNDSRYFYCWLGAERLKGHWCFIPEPGEGSRCQNGFESIVAGALAAALRPQAPDDPGSGTHRDVTFPKKYRR